MTDQRSTRKKGHYATGEPSVTTILNIVSKPGLTYWLQKQIYNATIDGAKTFAEAMAAVKLISTKAMDIGLRVHEYVEHYSKGITPVKYDDLMGYYKAYHQWLLDYKPRFMEAETTVTHSELDYKGTLDNIVMIKDKVCLVDLKTGKGIYDSVELQTSAYKQAYEFERSKPDYIDETWILLLEKGDNGLPTGKYQYEKLKYVPEVFNSVLKVYKWRKGFRK